MPGVTVEAASPALIEKVRVATTDGDGRFRINAIAQDSKLNIYTGEVEDGKRIQKFAPVLAGGQ